MIEAMRVYDAELIKEIITREDMWATVAEDGQAPNDYTPDVHSHCWLAMTSSEGVVGLYNLHAHNSILLEIHAHVLPEHRKEYSRATGIAALQWIYDSAQEYNKVIAQIPCIYENVKKFTCGFGFHVEGVNRSSYLKDGKIVDQWLLGITRDEINETLSRFADIGES